MPAGAAAPEGASSDGAAPRPLSARARAERAVAREHVGAGIPQAPAVPPELDEPSIDDPDDEAAGLSGIALLKRDLGAEIIGEYDME